MEILLALARHLFTLRIGIPGTEGEEEERGSLRAETVEHCLKGFVNRQSPADKEDAPISKQFVCRWSMPVIAEQVAEFAFVGYEIGHELTGNLMLLSIAYIDFTGKTENAATAAISPAPNS